MIVCIVVVFSICIVCICIMMRKNRDTERLTQSAIARELALAKQEGIEIPDDLDKRLSRF